MLFGSVCVVVARGGTLVFDVGAIGKATGLATGFAIGLAPGSAAGLAKGSAAFGFRIVVACELDADDVDLSLVDVVLGESDSGAFVRVVVEDCDDIGFKGSLTGSIGIAIGAKSSA